MSSKFTKLLMGGAVMAIMPATSAFAAGTAAGTSVTNTFDLSYSVGGQTTTVDDAGTATFVVDRKIDVDVASAGDVSGEANGSATQTFTVKNEGNSTVAYDLDFFQGINGTEDNFDTSNFVITVNGTAYTPNASGVVPTINVAPDATITVVVTSTLPNGADNGETADIGLVATTLNPDNTVTPVGYAAGQENQVATDTAANTIGGVETVFADDASSTDVAAADTGAGTGKHSDSSTITVSQANVNGTKEVAGYSGSCTGTDFTYPAAGATGANYMIPGNCVIYRITVNNNGTAAASGVAVEDVLPDNLVFQAASTDIAGGTLVQPTAGEACDGVEDAPKSTSECYVAVTGGTLTESGGSDSTSYLYIKALIANPATTGS